MRLKATRVLSLLTLGAVMWTMPPAHAAPPTTDPAVYTLPAVDPHASEAFWRTNPLSGQIPPDSGDTAIGPILTPTPHDAMGYAPAPTPYAGYTGSRQTGRILAADGDNAVSCTGSVISSKNLDLVLTAAHCVLNERGEPHTNIVFIPQHYTETPGTVPAVLWGATTAYVPTAYRDAVLAGERGSHPDDMALLRLRPDADGRPLGTLIGDPLVPRITTSGSFGITTTYGYPATGSPHLNGARMFLCTTDTREQPQPAPLTQVIADGCAVQGGHSGGPVISDQAGDLVGVVESRGTQNDTGLSFGVYNRLAPSNFGRILTQAERA